MARKTESIDDKGVRYLAEGRVRVDEVRRDPETGHVVSAVISVQGSGDEAYRVSCDGWGWFCTCPAFVTRCAHISAGQRIVSWEPRTGRPRLRIPSDLDALLAD